MSIEKFFKKYNSKNNKSIEKIAKKWKSQQMAGDFLGMEIMTGVIVSDALLNGISVDNLAPELKEVFIKLMGEKANSYKEIRDIVAEKYSPESLRGLTNKVQGQYGENVFVERTNGAELAKSGSQEGWDIKINRGDVDEYIQVKVYEDSARLTKHIEEINKKIKNGEIGNGEVKEINFAVNSDIFEEVKENAEKMGLPNKIYDIGANRDDIRQIIESGFDSVKENNLLDNFFSGLLGGTISSAAIHTAANAFLVWKCSKERSQAIEDSIYSSAVSAGGIAASFGTRAVITEAAILSELELIGCLLGPLGFVSSIGAGYFARGYLKSIASRKEFVKTLVEDLIHNKNIMEYLAKSSDLEKAS